MHILRKKPNCNRALWPLVKKHIKERLRCYMRTCSELLSAVFMFSVLVILEAALKDMKKNPAGQSLWNYIDQTVVFFSPDNAITRKLMHYICSDDQSELNEFQINCMSAHDEKSMLKFLRSNLQNVGLVALLLFKNVNTTMPNKLEYSIKYSNLHQLQYSDYDDLFPFETYTVPNVTFFTKLQWAVDRAFMETISGESIDHTLQLVEQNSKLEKNFNLLQSFLIMSAVLAPLPFFLYSASRFLAERRSGILGLIKLYGVTPNTVRLAHLCDSLLFSVVFGIVICTVLIFSFDPVLPYVQYFYVIVNTIIHMATLTALAFVMSCSCQDVQHADSIFVVTYMLTFMLTTLWYSEKKPGAEEFISSCLMPHAPVFLFWVEVLDSGTNGVGLYFRKISIVNNSKKWPVIVVWLFYLIHFLLLYSIAWYLDYLYPGKYGPRLKWNFVFK